MTRLITTLILFFLFSHSYAQLGPSKNDSLKLLLKNTFETVKQNSVYRHQVDWANLQAEVIDGLDSLRFEDFVSRVRLIFSRMGDNHGALFFNGTRINGKNKPLISIRKSLINPFKDGSVKIKTQIFENKYGYILIPGSKIGDNIQAIAQSVQDSLCNLNPGKLRGVIIDLRLNEGGSVYPLFTGLHQLFGSNNIGSFTDMQGKYKDNWLLKKGKFYQRERIVASVKTKCTCSKNIKVAVLLSQITASAGEMAAIAFKGRKNTIFIGEKTYGLTTANSVFKINGHLLAVATAFTADRTGKIYSDAVVPDLEIVEGDNFINLEQDTKIIEAIKWFKKINSH